MGVPDPSGKKDNPNKALLSASTPWIWYASLLAHINHLERMQRLATRFVTGIHHLPYEERLQQWWRPRVDLITAFQIFTGLLDVDPNLFFSPSHPSRPYMVLQGTSRRRRSGSAFSVRVVKYWNKLPASVATASSVNVFKKRLEEVWTEVFPHLLPWLNSHPTPFSLPPPSYLHTTH